MRCYNQDVSNWLWSYFGLKEQEEDPEVLIYDDHDQHHKRASVQTVIMRKTKSGQIFYINVEKFNNTW